MHALHELPGYPIHAVKSVNSAGVDYPYEYDANGNMTAGWDFSDPTQVASRTITYNADNMPKTIAHEYKGTISLQYDGDGTRVKKVVSGGSTTYYIGGHFEVANGIETKYIFGENLRIAKVTSSTKYFFHKNHLGSSTVMTDYPNGLEIESAEYLPIGLTRKQTGTEVTYYRFTDQELDAETGLYNYNARLYDPAIGIFISPDSIVPNPFDPQMLNRYSYARNNPLYYVDPSGHNPFVIGAILGAVIGAVSAGIAGIQNDWDPGAMAVGGVIGGVSAGAGYGVSGVVGELAGSQIAGSVAGAAAAVGVRNQLNRVTAGDTIKNAANNYLVQPTLYWVNAFNNIVIYPAFDLLALPDQFLGYATSTTFEERMAWAAQFPGGVDDVALGAVGAAGRLPNVLRGVSKRVPNPYGRLGGPAHRQKVADVVRDIESRKLVAEAEFSVKTINGAKSARAMDVVARDIQTGHILEVHQVGRTLKTKPKIPISRERAALRDVRHSPELRGARRFFHGY